MPKVTFKAGDIIFLKFNPKKTPSDNWPCLGSDFEIDCKILHSAESAGSMYYHVISGRGVTINVHEDFVVAPKDKELHGNGVAYICTVDTELCPKDTVFYLNNDYVCNDRYGIYIHLTRFNQYQEFSYFETLKS